jgi:hypothetical protein
MDDLPALGATRGAVEQLLVVLLGRVTAFDDAEHRLSCCTVELAKALLELLACDRERRLDQQACLLDVLLQRRVDQIDELTPVDGAVHVERGAEFLGGFQISRSTSRSTMRTTVAPGALVAYIKTLKTDVQFRGYDVPVTRYFHGGIAGLEVGHHILPPSVTGTPTTADYADAPICRRDRVYASTELRVARVYAALAPARTPSRRPRQPSTPSGSIGSRSNFVDVSVATQRRFDRFGCDDPQRRRGAQRAVRPRAAEP